MKKFHFVFVLLIVGALGLVYVFRAGWHPIALVDSELVWAWQWEKEYQSAVTYHGQAIDTYKLADLDDRQVKEIKGDLKLASFNDLIEKRIIAKNFSVLIGRDGQELIERKINGYLESSNLKNAAGALFNLEVDELVDLILIPKAEKELLEENLKKENRDFNRWLKSQKQNARVYIFLRDYVWTGEMLEAEN